MPSTPRLGIPYPAQTDPPDGPDQMAAIANALDNSVEYTEGLLASRPTSTSGSPGVKGRLYRATDDVSSGPNGTLYFDYGTGWQPIPLPGVPFLQGTLAARPAASAVASGTIYRASDDTSGGANGTYYINSAGAWDAIGGASLSTYKTVLTRQAVGINSGAVTGAGVFILGGEDISGPPSGPINEVPFYFDPTDYAVASRTTKLRIRANLATNATAPGSTFTVGLYPVTGSGGPATQLILTLGTVLTGSTGAFGFPGASVLLQVNSGDFAVPSAGHYIIGCACSGGVAVNAEASMFAALQARQV